MLMEKEAANTLHLDVSQGGTANENKAKLLAIAQSSEILEKEFDEKAKAVLGEEKFAVYKDYEETQPERSLIAPLKNALSTADQLTTQQEHDIIRAMYEERKNLPSMAKPDPDIFNSSAKMEAYLRDFAQLQANCQARASAILSPRQLKQFNQTQEQARLMNELGMKMASKLLSGSKASDNSLSLIHI